MQLCLGIHPRTRRADWSQRRNPPFAEDKEAGYAFGSNPPTSFNISTNENYLPMLLPVVMWAATRHHG
jgi:hypothetical protein